MKVNKDFVMRSIAGENILVPTGEAAEKLNGMITLNEVAAFMWQNLDSAGSKEALVKMILDEFEVDEETASIDVERFVTELSAIGMIKM